MEAIIIFFRCCWICMLLVPMSFHEASICSESFVFFVLKEIVLVLGSCHLSLHAFQRFSLKLLLDEVDHTLGFINIRSLKGLLCALDRDLHEFMVSEHQRQIHNSYQLETMDKFNYRCQITMFAHDKINIILDAYNDRSYKDILLLIIGKTKCTFFSQRKMSLDGLIVNWLTEIYSFDTKFPSSMIDSNWSST